MLDMQNAKLELENAHYTLGSLKKESVERMAHLMSVLGSVDLEVLLDLLYDVSNHTFRVGYDAGFDSGIMSER